MPATYTMTAETARTLRAELARLEHATTTIPTFKARQDARKAEIVAALASATIEPEPFRDERAERCLRSSAGGDDLDGNRHW